MLNTVVHRKSLKDGPDEMRRYSRQISTPTSQPQHGSEQNLAAFLPSKFAYATVRMRNMEDRNQFYRTVRGIMTIRGLRRELSVDVVDLLDGGNVENEADLDVEQIKELPLSMFEKRALNAKKHEGRGLTMIQRKYVHKRFMYHMRQKWSEILSKIQIWHSDMKKIEGNYGTGVVSYFVFIKWLSVLNLFNFILIFGFIVIPRFFTSDLVPDAKVPPEDCCDRNTSDTCNQLYLYNMSSIESNFVEALQHIVQGTGAMEYTVFFYGYYHNHIINFYINNRQLHYDCPIAYILIILIALLVSLFMTIYEASNGINYKFHEGDERFYQYCNLVFGGWDFCIDNEKAAQMKKIVLTNEIHGCLESEKLREERRNRSKAKRYKLIAIRFIINVMHIAILGGCGLLIYFVFNTSTEKLREDTLAGIERFLFEFLPSITIVCLNIVTPILFRIIVAFEKYSPNFTISILLIRSVFLRMASIIVFYASMYNKIKGSDCGSCWETFVGQQIYRLALTDFATHIILTFFVHFPRSLIANKYGHIEIVRFLCQQTFDLPKHVLDITYTQMLCWLGAFYAPLLTGMFVIILFLLFYIKKFACLVNSKPGTIIHKTSKSQFMSILLIAFAVAVFPVLYTIGEIEPSTSCGPFRDNDSIWTPITEAFSAPQWIFDIAEYITTIYVGIILFIILILLISYYISVNNANKHMAKVLKTQLLLEGHDKRFLLEKLSGVIREQQHTARTAF